MEWLWQPLPFILGTPAQTLPPPYKYGQTCSDVLGSLLIRLAEGRPLWSLD